MSSRRQFIVLGLFLMGGFVAYSNILNSYFLSDDFVQIGKVLSGDLSVVWGRAQGGFFRPLFIFSYLIDTKIWAARPFGFHLTNVAFHSLNAFLTYVLSLRVVQDLKVKNSTGRAVAIGAGALFLLHPSHTEAVSWISGRADLIATCFCLAALVFYLGYARTGRVLQLTLSLVSFTLALLAKESAICLPLLVVVLGIFGGHARQKTRRNFVICTALFVSILMVFVLVRSAFIGSVVGGYGVSQHLNFSPPWLRDRLLEASVRSVLPALPAELSRFLFKPLQSWVFILFSVVCASLIAAAIILRRRFHELSERREQNRVLTMIVVLFLGSLLPVINLRLTLYQTLGERFVYLPSVFSCLLMAYLAAILLRRQAWWLTILICILGFYSVRLYHANQSWREAAALSQSIKDELVAAATRDRLLIINAPDNLRGVPVFHNGLAEALEHFQNQKRFERVEIIAFEEIQSVSDEVALTRLSETLTIQLNNDKDDFARVEPAGCIAAVRQSRTVLELRAQPCAADSDLFLFDQGKMIRLPDR